jgi:hypothetical protein
VATKFNDEARARLVLRWEELEQERLQQKPAGLTDMQVMCLAVKIQQRTIEEQHKKIDKLRPEADYCNEVLESVSCFTTTQIAKELSMTVHDLTRLLNPRNADGSGAPMTTEIVNSAGEFPCSNWKNHLNFSTFEFDTDHFNFVLGRGGDVVAAGIIVSRKDRSGGWFRSNCQLVLNEAALGSDLCSLAQAVESSYAAYEIDMESEFYLNNAGVNGTGSTEDVAPSQPTYSTSATINGVSQNIAGGSVNATAPITRVVVSSANLGEVEFSAKVDGTGDAISPTSHDANGATFSDLNVAAGHNLVVYRGGTAWFTITAQASGDGGNE